MKVLLVDIGVDTLDVNFSSLGIKRKLKIILDCLIYTQEVLNDKFTDTTHQTLRAIITAPEYFFANSHSVKKKIVRQYPEKNARYIETKLVEYSGSYPQILIIPGTVAWIKNAFPELERPLEDTPDAYQTSSGNLYAALPTVKKKLPHEYWKDKKARGVYYKLDNNSYAFYDKKQYDGRYRQAIDVIKEMGTDQLRGMDIRDPKNLAPDNSMKAKLAQMSPEIQKQAIAEVQLSRNTAYFYFNGHRIYKYHKQSDYQEVLDAGCNIFIPGKNRLPYFTIPGTNIKIGIEICLDHACQTLARYIPDQQRIFQKWLDYANWYNYWFFFNNQLNTTIRNLPFLWLETFYNWYGVQIHLILSAAVPNVSSNQRANPNGYMVHSSSDNHKRGWLKGTFFNNKVNQITNALNEFDKKDTFFENIPLSIGATTLTL